MLHSSKPNMKPKTTLAEDVYRYWHWFETEPPEICIPIIKRVEKVIERGRVRELFRAINGSEVPTVEEIERFKSDLKRRIAHNKRHYQKLRLLEAHDLGEDQFALCFAGLDPCPPGRLKELKDAMARALDRRDWKFFSSLSIRLRDVALRPSELLPKVERLARRYWDKSYKFKTGQSLPPLRDLADKDRLRFLETLSGTKMEIMAMRKMLRNSGLSETPIPKWRKQRRGKGFDPKLVEPES